MIACEALNLAMAIGEFFDTIIIGSGGGGLSCALELHEIKVPYLLLERSSQLAAGLNQIQGELPNFLGGYFHSGEELRQSLVSQAKRLALNFLVDHEVEFADLKNRFVFARGRRLSAKTLVLATGYRKRKLLPEQEKCIRHGIFYDKRGQDFSGRVVAIAGGGDNAFMDAIELAKSCLRVFLIHRSGEFKARRDLVAQAVQTDNIEFLLDSKIENLWGEEKLERIEVSRLGGNCRRTLAVSDLLIRIGYAPNTEMFQGQVEMDSTGHIVIGADCTTSVAGVYAVGDIVVPGYPRLSTAVGHGAIAAGAIQKYLQGNLSGAQVAGAAMFSATKPPLASGVGV
jgi:thioredoxin reductase (NADPH)